jgi:hypothetical protein
MSAINDKMITIAGNAQYLQVQHRVLWLREQHPDAQIVTDIVTFDVEHETAVVRATVAIPNGGTATAYGTAQAAKLSRNKEKYLEWAETRAVGRALAFLGYSTAGAQDLDEDPDDLVDAPMPAHPRQQPQRPPAPLYARRTRHSSPWCRPRRWRRRWPSRRSYRPSTPIGNNSAGRLHSCANWRRACTCPPARWK